MSLRATDFWLMQLTPGLWAVWYDWEIIAFDDDEARVRRVVARLRDLAAAGQEGCGR